MPDAKIGLALSGGGARAMAFHLGCLRALHEFGILERVQVLSTVSGGSVIGALYAANDEPFPVFEARVRAALRRGLARPTIRAAFLTTEGPKTLLCWVLVGTASIFFRPYLASVARPAPSPYPPAPSMADRDLAFAVPAVCEPYHDLPPCN